MQRQATRKFYIVFLIGYLAYSAIYVARLNFSVASALFESAGTLNKAQIGMIGSIFSFTYAIFKVPNGCMGDALPPKKVVLAGLIITSISNLLVGIFPKFWSIIVLWGLNAYGQSMLWGPMLRIFSDLCSKDQLKKVGQILVSSVATGSVLGLLIATKCASAFGAAACFLIPGFIVLILALLAWRVFPAPVTDTRPSAIHVKRSLREICKEREFRQMIVPAMAHGMIKDNINVWLALYCIDTFAVDLKSVAGYIFFVPVLALVGRLLYPLVYRFLKDDYLISILSFAVCAAAAIPLCWSKASVHAAMVCLGVIAAMVSMINTHMLSAFPAGFAGSGNLSFVASVMDLLTYGGAGIGSIIFGALIQRYGYASMFGIWGTVSCVSVVFLWDHFRAGKSNNVSASLEKPAVDK